MKLTLSVIKAGIGSIGGHFRPSRALLDCVRQRVESEKGRLLTKVPSSWETVRGLVAPPRLLRRRHVADERTRVHRRHRAAGSVGIALARARRAAAEISLRV